MQSRVRNLLLFATVVLATITAAQFSSFLVNTRIPENTTVEISSILHLTHIRNHGGVFGMLQGSGWVFAGISFLLLLAVLGYLCKAEQVARYEYLCFGFITGGGASNILDRFIYGSVVDFIDVQHIPFWHYVFNTADVFIHIGIWPLLLIGLFFHPPDKKRIA